MDSSDPVINPSSLPTRLERFKEICLEKRILKGHLEKLIEKREALAIHELESAESELKRVEANAEEVRAQMKETRLAEVGGTAKSDEAMSHASRGHPHAAPLFNTADPEGDGPSPLDTTVVKDSARNSTSFKSAESPILLPTSDQSPVHTHFKLDPRSEECTPTIPIAEEDGQSCEKQLHSQARRYVELCEERRKLEMEIEEQLADEEKMALMRVESARTSLQVVKETIVEIRSWLKKANAGDIMASTRGTMANAGCTMVNIPPTVFNDGPHEGDGLENTDAPATPTQPYPSEAVVIQPYPSEAIVIQPYSSEAVVNRSPSVSDASTHNKSRPSLHFPESSRGSHFARRTLQSPEDTQATGSQIASTYKPRKKLTKRGHKQIERPRAVSHDGGAPQVQKGFLLAIAGA